MVKKLALLLVAVPLAVGCKSSGQSQPLAANTGLPSASLASGDTQVDEPDSMFSLSRVMQFARFLSPSSNQDGLVPKEVVQLTGTLNAVVLQASQLNTNDPPHVTAQKAEAILAALGPCEALMSSVQSQGLLNEEMTEPLRNTLQELRSRSMELIQLGARPETIGAVQYLAGQLRIASGTVAAMFSPSMENQLLSPPA